MNGKTVAVGAMLCGCLQAAHAVPGNLGSGNQVSTGGVTLMESTSSVAHNPALLFRALGTKRIQVSGLKLPAFALELGDVQEDFVDRLDELEQQIEIAEDDNRDYAERKQAAERVNDEIGPLISEIADAAKANLDLSMPVPAFPIVFPAFDGYMSVNLEAAGSAGVRMLNSETRASFNDLTRQVDVEDDTAVYLKSGAFLELGLGYSERIRQLPLGPFIDGDLYAGGRLHLIQATMSRQIAVVDDNDPNENDSAFDRIGDNYDANAETATTVDLDLGIAYIARQFTLGLQVRNLLSPEFDFSTLGSGCNEKPEPQATDCRRSRYYTDSDTATGYGPGAVPASEAYTLDPQLMLESTYEIADSGFTLLAGLELNPATSVSGDEYQWLHLGLSYAGPWWAPALRLGYRSNVASGGLNVISVGLRLFSLVALEAFQATDRREFDGEQYPRSAGVSIGLSTSF